MKLNVITGGPGVGKTSVLEALSKRGFNYIPEAARFLIGQGIQFGSDFQEMLVKTQILWEDKIDAVFADRGVIDGIGYCNHFGIELPRNLPNNLKNRYSRVFVLDPLSSYVNDDARRESKEESRAVHSSIIRAYTNLGYDPIFVPAVSIEERTDIITKELEIERERKFLIYENGVWYCDIPVLGAGTLVKQGYLEAPEGFSEMRIRQMGREHFLTKKNGNGEVRKELETKISKEEFDRLWPKTAGRRIAKERFEWEGFEIDRYLDRELIIAEAENRSIQIGKEVTGDERYSNRMLAR